MSAATEKMRGEGLPETAIDTFAHYEELLRQGDQGTLPESELEPLCQKDEIGVITYSSLASGFLTGKYQPGAALPASGRAAGVQQNFMNDLFVTPDARGSGWADALIAACVERCRARGVRELAWQTAYTNLRAQAVYDRVGATRDDRWLDYSLSVAPGATTPDS